MTARSSQADSLSTTQPKILIIGVGNPILGDDGIGITIVRELEKKHSGLAGVTFEEQSIGGLTLAERFIDYDIVIMVDALALEDGTPGKIHKLSMDDFATTIHSYCAHDCNLATAYSVLKDELGSDRLPREVIIFGIEIEVVNEFTEEKTEIIIRSIPRAVSLIETELAKFTKLTPVGQNKK